MYCKKGTIGAIVFMYDLFIMKVHASHPLFVETY